MIGFSEVTLTEQALADDADTLAYLGAAIRLYRDSFRRLGVLSMAVGGGPGQRPAAVAGGLVELAAEPVPLGPQLRRRQPLEIEARRSVDGQGSPPARARAWASCT